MKYNFPLKLDANTIKTNLDIRSSLYRSAYLYDRTDFPIELTNTFMTGAPYVVRPARPKGQLISKGLFGAFTFSQKTNENKSTSSKDELFRSFFGRK